MYDRHTEMWLLYRVDEQRWHMKSKGYCAHTWEEASEYSWQELISVGVLFESPKAMRTPQFAILVLMSPKWAIQLSGAGCNGEPFEAF